MSLSFERPRRFRLTRAEKDRVRLVSGRVNPELAEDTAHYLGIELVPTDLGNHPNGELKVRILENVRGKKVYAMQTHFHRPEFSIDSAIEEHQQLINASKGGGSKVVVAIAPNLGYGRQDRKSRPREPISAAMVAEQFEIAGADNFLAFDLHSQPIHGFFRRTVFAQMTAFYDHEAVMKRKMKGRDPSEFVSVPPDAGRFKTAQDHADRLGIGLAYVHKIRDPVTNEVVDVKIIGDIKGKTALISEDVISTGGTLNSVGWALRGAGAAAIYGFATHGEFTEGAENYLGTATSPFDGLWVTDTIPQTGNHSRIKDLHVLSMAKNIGKTMIAVERDKSISDVFSGANHS